MWQGLDEKWTDSPLCPSGDYNHLLTLDRIKFAIWQDEAYLTFESLTNHFLFQFSGFLLSIVPLIFKETRWEGRWGGQRGCLGMKEWVKTASLYHPKVSENEADASRVLKASGLPSSTRSNRSGSPIIGGNIFSSLSFQVCRQPKQTSASNRPHPADAHSVDSVIFVKLQPHRILSES